MNTNKLAGQVRDLFVGKALFHLVQTKFIQDCKYDMKQQWIYFITENRAPILEKLRDEGTLDSYIEKATKYLQDTKNNYERVLSIYEGETPQVAEDLITLIDSFIFRRDCIKMVKYNIDYWKTILPSYFDVYMNNSMAYTAVYYRLSSADVKDEIKSKIMEEILAVD